MKITNASMEIYRWNRPVPIRNGRYTYPTVALNLIKLDTDEGITGYGYMGGEHVSDDMTLGVFENMKRFVIGQDPFDNERLWEEMWQPKLVGRRGVSTRAISGIDIALWDIKGKAANRSVHKLLGAFTDRIPVYIAGGYYEEGKGLRELAAEMETAVEMGANAVKMKIGGAPINEDVERIRTARDAVGPDVKLLMDANCAYRYYEAIEIARKAERYDVYWFEEPVNPDDYEGHRLISRSTSIPIATGENEYTRYGFRDLINNRCAAIIQPDALIMGGVTEFVKVAALASAHDLPIAPHGKQEVHIHLAAAIPNGLILEYYAAAFDPMHGRVFEEPLEVADGHVIAPDRPGFGFTPNFGALAGYRVR